MIDAVLGVCLLCCAVSCVVTLINVKLFTEWVKHGILKGKD